MRVGIGGATMGVLIDGQMQDFFVHAPNALFRSRLTARAVYVLGNLLTHSAGFHVSINTIANQTGLSQKTVSSALNDLEGYGLITRNKRPAKHGEFERNEYVLHIARLVELGAKLGSGGKFADSNFYQRTGVNSTNGPAQNLLAKNNQVKKTSTREEHNQPTVDDASEAKAAGYQNDTSSRNTYPAEFEEWWATYPRKVGKGKAVKDWQRAMKRTDNHTLINASRRLAAFHEAEGTDPRFIPHPSTWLNRDGWDDDLTPSMPRRQADGTRPEDWAIRRGEPMSEMARNIDRLFGRPADVIDGECWEEQPKEIGQ